MKRRGKRIEKLCAFLTSVETFADVGCDHGYCVEYMLDHGLCRRAIASDISAASLKKAEVLLAEYIREGRVQTVVGNGFFGIPSTADGVLIAGMGGAEIVGILSDEKHGFLPERFWLQPMHNGEELRRYLVENGGYIERDLTFYADGKFYDFIAGRKRKNEPKQAYSELEYEFGRENVREKGEDFKRLIRKRLSETEAWLKTEGLQEESRRSLETKRERLKEAIGS